MQQNLTTPNIIYIDNDSPSNQAESINLLSRLFVLLAEGIEECKKTACK